jgi:hypothetical protein
MAERLPTAKNLSVLMRSLSAQPRQTWLWLAPYVAIGVFALAMLVVTALLQWRELRYRAVGARRRHALGRADHRERACRAHQDFLERTRSRPGIQAAHLRILPGPRQPLRARRRRKSAPSSGSAPTARSSGWPRNESTVTFVGDQLAGPRLAALQEALRIRRTVVSPDYRDATLGPMHDIIFPVQRGRADIGAFIAIQSLETMLRATLPTAFTARYSLTVVDAQDREVFSNSSVKPDRPPAVRCHQPRPAQQPARPEHRRLPWRRRLAALPAGGADHHPDRDRQRITLIQLRRHARAPRRNRGATARRLRLPPGDVAVADHRPARHRPRRPDHLRQCRLLPDDRLRSKANCSASRRPTPTGRRKNSSQLRIQHRHRAGRQGAGRRLRDAHHAQERRALRCPPLLLAADRHQWPADRLDGLDERHHRAASGCASNSSAPTNASRRSSTASIRPCMSPMPHSGEILFANRAFQNIFGFDSRRPRHGAGHRRLPPAPEALHRDPAAPRPPTNCPAKSSTARSSTPCPATGTTCTNAPSAGWTGAPCASSSPPTSPTASTSTRSTCSSRSAWSRPRA